MQLRGAMRLKGQALCVCSEIVSQPLLVPVENIVQEFLFNCNKVGTTVRPDGASDATTDCKTLEYLLLVSIYDALFNLTASVGRLWKANASVYPWSVQLKRSKAQSNRPRSWWSEETWRLFSFVRRLATPGAKVSALRLWHIRHLK